MDQCVKMVLNYYVKPEFHKSAFEDFVDDYKKDNHIKNTDLVSTALVH